MTSLANGRKKISTSSRLCRCGSSLNNPHRFNSRFPSSTFLPIRQIVTRDIHSTIPLVLDAQTVKVSKVFYYLLTFGTGTSLLRRLVLAIPDAITHNDAFITLHESLRQKHGPEVAKWEEMMKDWERDSSKPDPYEIPEECKLSLSSIHAICSLMMYCSRCWS